MLEVNVNVRFGLVMVLSAVACSSPASEKSTGSNWVTCDTDADCSPYPGATCGTEKVCVDQKGEKILKSSQNQPDGGSGAGGAENGDASTAGGSPGSGGAAPGGASGTSPGGVPNGDASTGGAAAATVLDCYSPGQNLDHAYDTGAIGCRCATGSPGFCVNGVALVCTDGRWQAVEDGPCTQCWTPDEPDLAAGNPSNGCACTTENETACMSTLEAGVMGARCSQGKWVVERAQTPCNCTSDKRCGFGGKCVNNACASARCLVDGVRYAAGVGNIAHPLDCNTCVCGSDGQLTCSKLPCPTPDVCPTGYTSDSTCNDCTTSSGGCGLTQTGCIRQCQTHDDCSGNGNEVVCDTTRHLCFGGVCI